MSSPQVVTTVVLFDYILDTTGAPVVGVKVNCTLQFNESTIASPAVSIGPKQQTTTTDQNGYYQFTVVPNISLSPVNTTYLISTPFNTYEVSIPSGAGPFQVTNAAVLVNQPGVLSPAATNLTGPITVTGNESVTGNLSVAGTTTLAGTTTGALTAASESVTGDLTVGGRILETTAASKLVPGATSMSIRDNADANDNFLVSNAGLVTARAGLVATAGGVLATAGDLIATAGRLVLNAAAAKIKGGATSLSLRNNADSADNVLVLDNGNVTVRGTLTSSTTNFRARAYRSTSQSISTNPGLVQYDTVSYDPNSNFTTGATAKYTVPLTGKYLVIARLSIALGGVSTINLQIFVNGSVVAIGSQNVTVAGTWATVVMDIVNVSTGDTIQIQAGSSATPFTADGGSNLDYFDISYQGP